MTTAPASLSSVRYLPRWVRCRPTSAELAEVCRRVEQLPDAMRGPLTDAGLDAIPLSGSRRNRWWRLKLPPYRVFFLPAGDEVIVAELDRRDDNTYEDLARLDRYLVVREGAGLRVVVADDRPAPAGNGDRPHGREHTSAARREQQNPLSPLTDARLAALGLDAGSIAALRTFGAGVDVAQELAGAALEPEAIEMVAAAWHDPQRVLAIFDEGRTPSADELLIDAEELARRAASPDSATSLAALDEASIEAILEGSVEEWMFYLHPSQARIVQAEPTGPARIRGGPGTGKTVAALHRAAWLARTRRAERVLVTTFVSLLPKVWEALYAAFAPDVREQITTATVDSLAWRLVRNAGGTTATVAEAERRGLLERALVEAPGAKEALAGGPDLLGAEIDKVIAGRGLDLDGYLSTPRRGRGRALSQPQRLLVWAAYDAYRRLLAKDRKTDWVHLRQEALRLARAGAGPRFDAVIVDESQDLTEGHLELLLALDADPAHRALLLVGDGQQAIYPGGFSLLSVGLDVRGRSYLLRTNWRNTQLIANAAEALMVGIPFGDLEDAPADRVRNEVGLPRRLGEPPTLHTVPSPEVALDVLREVVEDLLGRYAPGDVAVLAPMNAGVREAASALKPHPTLDLSQYDGGPVDAVRIGTWARSKGMEFKAVVLTNPTAHALHVATGRLRDEADRAEAEATWTRTLFVAMTRARDDLVLIANGRLPDPLETARSEFNVEVW